MLWTHEDNYLPAPAVPLMDELPVWIWMSSWACWAGPEELSGRPTSPVCSAPALPRALVWPPVLQQPCRAFWSSFVMQTFAFVGQKEPCVRLLGYCEGPLDNVWPLKCGGKDPNLSCTSHWHSLVDQAPRLTVQKHTYSTVVLFIWRNDTFRSADRRIATTSLYTLLNSLTPSLGCFA